MKGTTVGASGALPAVLDTNWSIVKIGDAPGDGKANLFWRNSVTESNSVWLMNGATVAVSATLPAVADTNWQIAGPP